MATRTAANQRNNDPDWEMPIDGQLVETIEETASDRVAAMLAESIGDDRAKVKLMRALAEQPGKFGWCKDYSVVDFEAGGFEMVRRDWGPGEYQVILYGVVPNTKKYTIRAREVVTIMRNNSDETTTIPGLGAVPTGIEHAFRTIAQQNEQIVRALTERPQVDPMAQMRNMLELAALMKQAFGGGERTPVGELLEGIKQIQGVAKDLAPGAEKEAREPTMMELAPKLLDILSVGMQQRQQQPQVPQIAMPVSLTSAPTPAPNPQPSPTMNHQPQQPEASIMNGNADIADNPAILILQGYLQQLVDMAKNGASPDVGAELLAEKLPDEFVEFIHLPTWFELLAYYVKARVPEIINHRVWLTQVRNLAIPLIDAAMQADDSDGTTNPPAPAAH